ncbi:hypothetical protein PICMEDRAFT_123377 [Pichia membranifaciens NRRL Y-2026]|uniref:Uncharacterized protein n=1 Tax=Pichia membranifaciens NRRL Y-2026 TaxID=763406 RepID=A0A1E3NRC5_9ASCO|nr:hypothetical protein PICMEDRAFT_123377 [Pichia membranifaciens NRRL Y-2026]ODQ48113.1 hypothetical protein PICMEDRAFT_123377 [Pichia membranifaciens NRRL Y-2026]
MSPAAAFPAALVFVGRLLKWDAQSGYLANRNDNKENRDHWCWPGWLDCLKRVPAYRCRREIYHNKFEFERQQATGERGL